MSATSGSPQLHNNHLNNQLAAIPRPTAASGAQKDPSVVEITTSTKAFEALEYVVNIQASLCHGIQSKEEEIADLRERLQGWEGYYEQQSPQMKLLKDLVADVENKNNILIGNDEKATREAEKHRVAHAEAVEQLSQGLEEEKRKASEASSDVAKLREENAKLKASAKSLKQEAEDAREDRQTLVTQLHRVQAEQTSAWEDSQESRENLGWQNIQRYNTEQKLRKSEQELENALQSIADSGKTVHEANSQVMLEKEERADEAEAELTWMRKEREQEDDILKMLLSKRTNN